MFFEAVAPLPLGDLARLCGARLVDEALAGHPVHGIAPLDSARSGSVSFLDNPAYLRFVSSCRASACFIVEKHAGALPSACAALITSSPYAAFAKAAAHFFPRALRPQSMFGATGVSPGAFVHPDAVLEVDVIVDPGAVIGPCAEIGRGTLVCAQAVIGPGVRIGRDCAIGPCASVTHALLGNRVIIHAGARIGKDGFGFVMGPGGHRKVVQVGRVIIQDDVEIGANTTIDRGQNRDTIIGEGTKIDNLVQVAHNAVIGRHCVIVGQVGISGSATLEDYVVVGGQAGVAGHIRIGQGAQIGAQSGVMNDLEPGKRYLGAPARPARDALREIAVLSKLARPQSGGG